MKVAMLNSEYEVVCDASVSESVKRKERREEKRREKVDWTVEAAEAVQKEDRQRRQAQSSAARQ
jgi:hypothetical protein